MSDLTQETAQGIVALFNASDDTIDMIQTLLTAAGSYQTLIWCHFSDLKKGIVDFRKYLEKHKPEVVIFDLSPPYDENWQFFKVMRDAHVMGGRGIVLTTTNKNRLDEVLGEDSYALEVVGRPNDLQQIDAAIKAATRQAEVIRLPLSLAFASPLS
jgi:DNA-binding response OmpR family regulator